MSNLKIHYDKAKFELIDSDTVEEIWEKCNLPGETFPKSWPLDFEEFKSWALSMPTLSTSPNDPKYFVNIHCVIFLPCSNSDDAVNRPEESDTVIAGIACCDLVTQANIDLYPGANIGDVNVSYMTFRGFRGGGLATTAVREMTNHVLDSGRFPVLRINSANGASLAVAKKLDFFLTQQTEVDDPACEEVQTIKTFRGPVDPIGFKEFKKLDHLEQMRISGLDYLLALPGPRLA